MGTCEPIDRARCAAIIQRNIIIGIGRIFVTAGFVTAGINLPMPNGTDVHMHEIGSPVIPYPAGI